jgi:hypothetical protein
VHLERLEQLRRNGLRAELAERPVQQWGDGVGDGELRQQRPVDATCEQLFDAASAIIRYARARATQQDLDLGAIRDEAYCTPRPVK